MAAVYDVCGKEPGSNKSASYSHACISRCQNSNIQRIRAVAEGTPKCPNVCIRCLRSDRATHTI